MALHLYKSRLYSLKYMVCKLQFQLIKYQRLISSKYYPKQCKTVLIMNERTNSESHQVLLVVNILILGQCRKSTYGNFLGHCTVRTATKPKKNNKVIKFKNNRGQKSSFLGQNMSQHIF